MRRQERSVRRKLWRFVSNSSFPLLVFSLVGAALPCAALAAAQQPMKHHTPFRGPYSDRRDQQAGVSDREGSYDARGAGARVVCLVSLPMRDRSRFETSHRSLRVRRSGLTGLMSHALWVTQVARQPPARMPASASTLVRVGSRDPFGVLSIPRLSAYLQPQGELVRAAKLAGLVFGRSS